MPPSRWKLAAATPPHGTATRIIGGAEKAGNRLMLKLFSTQELLRPAAMLIYPFTAGPKAHR